MNMGMGYIDARDFDDNMVLRKRKENVIVGDFDTNTQATLLNGLGRGDDVYERNGRQIEMINIQFSAIAYPVPDTGRAQHARMMIVYDHQTNGTAISAEDVLTAPDTVSFSEIDNHRRFDILMDKCVSLVDSGKGGDEYKYIWYNGQLHLDTTYNSGTTGHIEDITTGSLYLIAIGTQTPGDTAGLYFARCRVTFKDQ